MVEVSEQDAWITHLGDCKQLSETDVKRLCDKVSRVSWRCGRSAHEGETRAKLLRGAQSQGKQHELCFNILTPLLSLGPRDSSR
jgi:hypothetical protein